MGTSITVNILGSFITPGRCSATKVKRNEKYCPIGIRKEIVVSKYEIFNKPETERKLKATISA